MRRLGGVVLVLVLGCGGDDAAESADGGGIDAAAADAGLPDAAVADAAPIPDPMYTALSQTGLYSDFGAKTLNPDLIEFEPLYPLWSDGAVKRRWIYLPPGQKIDTSDMDNWLFPVGTKIFKQFSYVPEGGGEEVILETRLIERIAPGDLSSGWWRGSFSWFADGADVTDTPLADPALVTNTDLNITFLDGVNPPLRADHIVPRDSACVGCHGGSSSRILGFQAIQLSHDKPIGGNAVNNVDWLWSQGYLTDQPQAGGYPVPDDGTGTARAALGYLHANCGHCHSPPAVRFVFMACYETTANMNGENMAFRLLVSDATVESTLSYQSAVNEPAIAGGVDRIEPGDADQSRIWQRISIRGAGQMPPAGSGYSNVVDTTGIQPVADWINGLTP